jgi:DNA-binding NtrC family response regulator
VAQREGKRAKTLEPHALELMVGYAWPGNVRELQNICERAAVLTHEQCIRAAMVAPWLGAASSPAPVAAVAPNGVTRPASMIELMGDVAPQILDARAIVCDGRVTLDDIEREIIVATLEHNNGHRQRSAAALGIGVRTLGLKLKKWKDEKLVSDGL